MSFNTRRKSNANQTVKKRKSLTINDEPAFSSRDLPVLRRKRTLALNRLKKTLEVAELAKQDNAQLDAFLAHYSVVQKQCDNFEEAHSDILCVVDSESEEQEDMIREQFDLIYFDIKTIHMQLFPLNAGSQTKLSGADHSCISNVKLPKINIPTFSGAIKEWPKFFDLFNSLIHNNQSLSDVERIHFLFSSVSGDALALIRTYPAQGAFYREAYQILTERYQNKRELAFTCWKEILNINLKLNSPLEFRRALDHTSENLNILRGLGLPTNEWDFIICYHFLSKLDSQTRCAYERKHTSAELPKFKDLLNFLHNNCEALVRDTHFSHSDRVNVPTNRTQAKSPAIIKSNHKPSKPNPSSVFLSNTNNPTTNSQSPDSKAKTQSTSVASTWPVAKCSFCSENHSVSHCKRFEQTPVAERIEHARSHRWCFNCLKPSHHLKDCRSIFRCQKCRQRHHTLLHLDQIENAAESSQSQLISDSPPNNQVRVLTSVGNNSTILLSTANVQVRDSLGNFQSFRALIDSGSQAHFITESAADRLRIDRNITSRRVRGLGQSSSTVTGTVTIEIGVNGQSLFTINALTLPSICGKMPSTRLDASSWRHLHGLTLADPDCHKPGHIDLLLGAEIFASMLLPGNIGGGLKQPSALNSVFGWILVGGASCQENPTQSFFINEDDLLHKEVKRLWELDSFETTTRLTPDEQRCEEIFLNRHTRESNGRYVVTLPFKDDHCLTASVTLDDKENPTLKVLGLKWDPISDCFFFSVTPQHKKCTKRNILSELARNFDPLGFLSPLTIVAKVLVQRLWVLGVGWDDDPPEDVISHWNRYLEQLPLLQSLQIPRCVSVKNLISCELHGFSDSSQTGYGAVVYLRTTDASNNVEVFFVYSKGRVAPTKTTSLPRLELCAAVLLADLLKFVERLYLPVFPCSGIFAWSDSTVVLAWLRSHSSRWKTFVANRVSHILDVIPGARWSHVASEDNPADVVSRGQLPSLLIHNRLWWAGPSWLSQPASSWPCTNEVFDQNALETEEKSPHSLHSHGHSSVLLLDTLLERYSSIRKIQRLVCVWTKFIDYLRSKRTRCSDLNSNRTELHKALMIIVKHVQSRHFATEIQQLQDGTLLSKQMRKLNPFIDAQGVLRVGGRLSRSGLEFEHKYPALIPRESRFTIMIIEAFHRENCHAGVNTMQYLLTQQFWILSAKRAIRHCLSKCLQCYKTNPTPLEPFMSDLPAVRVNQVKPFSVVGTDYGGPFRIKLGKHRGAKIGKAYLCLFVCLTTKALHLETVSDLSSDAFLAALRRFVGRRGRVSVIHSDCGTNYVGASNQLNSLMQSASHSEKIEFRFNPPASPHFGGVWEIQIKAVKSHLYRIVGEQTLTFEELSTLFVQIESMLNSRPLCPLSSDPNDLNVLTPGHFLTLEPLTSVPDDDLTSINIHRLGRWQLIQRFQQDFWNRWRQEYLQTLTQRAKWTKDSKPLNVGSVVILKSDNTVPLHWPLARVEVLHTSPDGVVRIATIRTVDGSRLTRPLTKLCPLPNEIN